MNELKCNRCAAFASKPGWRSGDLCPACRDGTLFPAEPVVFANARDFQEHIFAVTIQAGVKPDGTEVLKIGNHVYRFTVDGWQPHRPDGTEVFNIRRNF